MPEDTTMNSAARNRQSAGGTALLEWVHIPLFSRVQRVISVYLANIGYPDQ
jgi:hypothetical protein